MAAARAPALWSSIQEQPAAPGLCSAPCSERPQPAAPSSSPFLRCEASLARPGVPACVQEPGERPARTASIRLVVPAGWPHAAGCREVCFSSRFFFKGVLFSCRALVPGARGGDSCAWCHLPGGVSAARGAVSGGGQAVVAL